MTWLLLVGFAVGLSLAILAIVMRRADLRRMRRALDERRDAHAGAAPLLLPNVDLSRCLGCGTCIRACPEDGVLQLVHGQAVVVNASACVGHARCEQECPVGAIQVGIVDAEQRRDIPVLTAELEVLDTPGLFLAGELTGRSLIRGASLQGLAVAAAVARRRQAADAEDDVLDLLIVGAGPAGLACALAAKSHGLRHLLIDREPEIGGTVARYPRRKLVLTEPLELPLLGRQRRMEYSKEELVALWQHAAQEHELQFRGGLTMQGVSRRRDGVLSVMTDGGGIRARAVCLSLGRRGVPRRLGVPGEDLTKVAYGLLDAGAYTDSRVLVVGGGNSAVETALALAEQGGNEVTLAHRRSRFDRVRKRNAERLQAAVDDGQIKLLLDSEVTAIADAAVTLRQQRAGGSRKLELGNDHVFVQIGGELPFALLEKCGVSFDPARRPAAPAPAEEPASGLLSALSIGLAATLLALLFVVWHADYYLADGDLRAADGKHALLGPATGIGLGFGFAAVVGLGLNLAYLLRRQGSWLRLGSLRLWMNFHVATGVLALLIATLHSGFLPAASPGGYALGVMLLVGATGAIGRWFYAWVPRAANGRELELAAVKERIAQLDPAATGIDAAFVAEARAAMLAEVERRQWGGTLLGRIGALVGVQFDLARLRRRLRRQGVRCGVPPEQVAEVLALAAVAHRAALSVAHFEDLRALLASWRYLHRWLSVLLVLLLVVHVIQWLIPGGGVGIGGTG